MPKFKIAIANENQYIPIGFKTGACSLKQENRNQYCIQKTLYLTLILPKFNYEIPTFGKIILS